MRVEEVVVDVTHQGHPFSFNDLPITISRVIYTPFKGTWMDLSKKLTRHAIISCAKSLAGLSVRPHHPPSTLFFFLFNFFFSSSL